MGLYFIALILPENLNEQIRELKLEIAERFSAKHALKLPAHITLQPPLRMDKEQESQLSALLEKIVKHQSIFPVELDGFGSFAPRVIFIEIKDKQPLLKIYNKVEGSLYYFTGNEKKELLSFHPHITIATRDLDRKLFPKAWAEFRDRDFGGIFQAQKIALLKHNGKSWEVKSEFYFVEN